ncbi:polyketide cyclase/dehydrase/lipid transport protein [Jatrophihabitans sp. GAS493]|uniref:SRPBCC family protein n=1 Tax=Jatrophihabitans sp. GAS493 TaxID=1907575 RepID=UPI000BC0A685|nr:SRPBCC family protein [Jatrophihabitans sp. GAS493]SOD71909.1 polyketide cyclase/dehydrase/lipid transport protein [Jatrophihabitans sp. GAS493]
MVSTVSYTVTRTSRVGVQQLFDEVVQEDVLPKVLHRYLLIPAVSHTEGNTGPWDVPGSVRTIRFTDGTSAREEVLEWESGRRFGYRVDHFSNALGPLATHAIGEWDFQPAPDGSGFHWTYTFYPRNRAAVPAVRLLVRLIWRGYMAKCADRCVELAERASAD